MLCTGPGAGGWAGEEDFAPEDTCDGQLWQNGWHGAASVLNQCQSLYQILMLANSYLMVGYFKFINIDAEINLDTMSISTQHFI